MHISLLLVMETRKTKLESMQKIMGAQAAYISWAGVISQELRRFF